MIRHPLDPETAERLLSGPTAGPEGGLGALLAALRAAATPAELRGEPAVMSAFRAARSGRPQPASPGPAGGSSPPPGVPTGRS
ncbi:hypothetical protein [Micromonospora rifamycinica]|uniref:Uncharacterized protein n=1 Tax=Micromonospora rifamycinica TaxID=291594 RepID=A0A125Q145_9ACTN|nr:hypothetical protein [Micromonospora rifamycinica]KWV31022.1 hypothetical protein AWV63_19890 [Micromonospora rifamycinica]SCG50652.1 hypothetical protein GA0070623_1835 [Micromonospora rifamycinica]